MLDIDDNPQLLASFKKNGQIFPPLIAQCSNCCFSKRAIEQDDFTVVCYDKLKTCDIDDWCVDHDLDLGKTDFEDEYSERIDKLVKLGKFITESEIIKQKSDELYKLINK